MTQEEKIAVRLFSFNWIGVAAAVGVVIFALSELGGVGGYEGLIGLILLPNIFGFAAHFGYFALFSRNLSIITRKFLWIYSAVFNFVLIAGYAWLLQKASGISTMFALIIIYPAIFLFFSLRGFILASEEVPGEAGNGDISTQPITSHSGSREQVIALILFIAGWAKFMAGIAQGLFLHFPLQSYVSRGAMPFQALWLLSQAGYLFIWYKHTSPAARQMLWIGCAVINAIFICQVSVFYRHFLSAALYSGYRHPLSSPSAPSPQRPAAAPPLRPLSGSLYCQGVV